MKTNNLTTSECFKEIKEKLKKADGLGNIDQQVNSICWLFIYTYLDYYDRLMVRRSIRSGIKYASIISEDISLDFLLSKSNEEIFEHIEKVVFPYFKELKPKDLTSKLGHLVFSNTQNYFKKPVELKECLDLFLELQFDGSSFVELKKEFETIFYELTKGKDQIKKYTRREIVDLLVELSEVKCDETVYDLAFGTGGFLKALYLKQIDDAGSSSGKISKVQTNSVHGIEKNALRFSLGVINLFLEGIQDFNLSRSNSLTIDVSKFDCPQYDMIICNPDFNTKEEDRIGKNFPITNSSPELAFLQHAMCSLNSTGRAFIFVPDGVIFQSGDDYVEVKKNLINQFNLKAILKLDNTSGAQSTILYFDKDGVTENIWFHRVPLLNKKKITETNYYTKNHFEELLSNFKERQPGPNSWIVSKKDIEKNVFNLSFNLYDPYQEEAEPMLEPVEYIKMIDQLLDSSKMSLSELRKEFEI